MLYSLYEAQHAWLTPFRLVAEAQRGWLTNPFMPWAEAPLAKKLAASNDLFLRVTQRYEKPEWRVAGADMDVALDLPFCKLLHFVPSHGRSRAAPKVLVVAPLSGHHATLLRDTVRTLVAGGAPPVAVVALNDEIADGRDVSWIWDVDFEPLSESLERLVAAGKRAEELALRFKYGGLDPARIDVVSDLDRALDRGLELVPPGGELAVLPTYTAMLALRDIAARRGLVRQYWESVPA